MFEISSTVLLIALCFLAAAALYSSVGHAGASGYLAVMALFGLAPETMRPTALLLNILVALIASYKFYRAGAFSWSLLWPFALTSVPAAFVGGRLSLPDDTYRAVVGMVLLYAAWRMYQAARASSGGEPPAIRPARWIALLAGLGIGLLSGLTGVGGGIFLSPLLLMMGWARMRESAGVAAVFILVNSTSGLLGVLSLVQNIPSGIALWAPAVLVGGWVGAEYGSRRLATPILRQLLCVVLLLAGLKMIFT
ncbi:MAG: sulfite exporter TauE/SafE family protein [Gemmatimonadota bacterium]